MKCLTIKIVGDAGVALGLNLDIGLYLEMLALLRVWWRAVPMKKKRYSFPKAMIPDAVDNDITAAVSCQDPEGKKGKAAPSVTDHIAQYKYGNGRERGCKSKGKDTNSFGCLDVRKGGSKGASASTSLKPFWEEFALAGVAADASEGQDVNYQSDAQECEVECWK